MNNLKNGFLDTQIENKIANVSFFHPQSNAFPSELLSRLTQEIEQLSQNEDVNLILLKSEGSGAFCAGANFDELLSISDFETGKAFFLGFANLINAMRTCSKIIVGKIHGKAVGGGVGIIAACDYALASEEAWIKLSELTIGIGPFVIEPVVSRKIGKSAMAELAFAPNLWKDALWAKNKGLYSVICENQSHLDTETKLFCSKFAEYNPKALQQMKKIIWEGTENWNTLLHERAAISGNLVLSDFTKNALSKLRKNGIKR